MQTQRFYQWRPAKRFRSSCNRKCIYENQSPNSNRIILNQSSLWWSQLHRSFEFYSHKPQGTWQPSITLHHFSEVLDGFLHFLQFRLTLSQLHREKKIIQMWNIGGGHTSVYYYVYHDWMKSRCRYDRSSFIFVSIFIRLTWHIQHRHLLQLWSEWIRIFSVMSLWQHFFVNVENANVNKFKRKETVSKVMLGYNEEILQF